MNSHESPWVFLFSRFTSEALLFEGLLIFSLVAVYSAFFVLRKRKYGSIKTQVPAGVVKYYLNELIGDAEQIRAQLFGLLYSSGVPATGYANAGASNTANFQAELSTSAQYSGPSPADTAALKNLESKLAEQAKQIEIFIAEKARIEKELAEARLKGAGSTDSAGSPKLQEKINILEAKLAEYSVIEDDLANLKRLQQENAQLKASLKGKTGSPDVTAALPGSPAAAATPKMAAPAREVSTPTPTLEAAAPPSPTPTPELAANIAAKAASEAFAAKAAEQDAKLAANSAATATQAAAAFEGLVDQVEKSLSKPEEEAPIETAPSTTAALAATIEKSDADLVAEFEKMLNG